MPDSNWTQKGATLSDKSARKEFGLTQEKIIDAIKCGKLQYRQNHIHGNPYFRLLRTEVKALAKEIFGEDHLKKRKLQNDLSQANKEIKRLKPDCFLCRLETARFHAYDWQEPYDERLSRTDLWERGGEIPLRHPTRYLITV